MLAALIIVFREIIEAGLVVGIVAAVMRGISGSHAWIAGGVLAGVLASGLVALFTGAIAGAFSGSGQELLNAAILAIAVIMLTWHNVWMARHGKEIAERVRAVGRAVASGAQGQMALAIIVGVAVLREGSEIVLFLYGIFVSGGESVASLALGGVLGLGLGALLSYLTYRGLLRIPSRHIFRVTGALITLLAAGMAAQAIGFLESAGIMTALDEVAWDTSSALSEGSIAGRILHTLVGYTEQPTTMQILVYLMTIVIITLLSSLMAKPSIQRVNQATAGSGRATR
jgi:high-affinity iron transporter